LWADHLSDRYPTAIGRPGHRLSEDALRRLEASDDEFLELCERLWMLAKEEEVLQTQAAEAKRLTTPARRSMARELGISRGPTACDEIADRIEFNLVKRRLLLSRIQEMAVGLRSLRIAPHQANSREALANQSPQLALCGCN
jgi:hypothetical protein